MNASPPLRLAIRHDSLFEYREPTPSCVMLVRLCPFDDRGQRLRSFEISTDPPALPVASDDGFGNLCHMFSIVRRHDRASLRSESVVESAGPPGVPDRLEPAAWDLLAEQARAAPLWPYLAPSRFARPGEALARFVERTGLASGADPLSTLRGTCAALNALFTYAPGSTSVDSEIDSILETGEGVCQDYTHVMIALGRSWGIPSRYVSGYLRLEGRSGEQTPRGASHAWAEFWLPELGWTGFDPTNDTVADHRHIRIAHGRDYADAAPTRGVVYGGGEARVTVAVTVDALEGDAPGAGSRDTDGRPWATGRPWRQAVGRRSREAGQQQ